MKSAVLAWLNRWRRALAHAWLYRRVFGERSQGRLLLHARISPSSCIECEPRLVLGDHVFIGHFCFIDASQGVTLEEGVQVTSHVCIVSHSSHRSVRLLGRSYTAPRDGLPPGYVAAPVLVGAYSFIGPHSVIEAGSTLGRGSLVHAGSVVRGGFPDFAVLAGNPAVVVGDTRHTDATWLERHPDLKPHYAAWAGCVARIDAENNR
jgi:acetyltransferase-like isoleucine patch superfamily enzyme